VLMIFVCVRESSWRSRFVGIPRVMGYCDMG
jgi:hypothetical protein